MNSAETGRFRWFDKELVTLVGLVALAALLRLLFSALPRVVRMDEAGYQLIARSLLAGQGYCELLGSRDLQLPPLISYLSVAGRLLGLPLTWSTALPAHVLLGSLLPLPVYGLARGITGRRKVAIMAALLVAVHPALTVSPLYWGTMTEPPYVLFVCCGLYAAWRFAADGGWRWAVALGMACGLAYLTRPEAILYLALGLGFVLLYRWRPRRADLRAAGLAVAVFVLLASPYVIYLHRATGRWEFSGKQGISMDIAWAFLNHDQVAHDMVVSSLDATGQEIMWLSAEQYDRTLTGWIREDPSRFLWQVKTNMWETWDALVHQDLLNPWLLALAALGITARPLTRARVRRELLLWLALAPLAALWVFFVLSRFLAVAVPIILVWTALGIEQLAGWLAATRERLLPSAGTRAHASAVWQLIYALPLACVVITLLISGVQTARRAIASMPFDRIAAGQWLASLVPMDAPLMARDSDMALYADRPAVALPNAEWPQVLNYARTHHARYLVVEDADIRRFRAQLTGLLDKARPLPGLRLIAERAVGSRTTLLYALSGAQ